MKKSVLFSIFAVIFFIGVALTRTTEYTREFQIDLDLDYFDNRDDGINNYYNSFSKAADISLKNFETTQSVRVEYSYDVSGCDCVDNVSQRDYVWGDWEGTTITQIKSSERLSKKDAEDETFDPSSKYSDETITYIEFDIHSCDADYSATSRVFLDSLPKLNTCDDVNNFFPDAVSGSNDDIKKTDNGYTFTAFCNGTYLGGKLTLDVTLFYDNLNDAVNNKNPSGGEFSFTMYSADGNDFSSEQTDMGVKIYEDLLDKYSPSDYPCDPPVDISDFFDKSYNSSSSLLPPLVLCLILLFVNL